MSDVEASAPVEVTVPLDTPSGGKEAVGSQIPETQKPEAPKAEAKVPVEKPSLRDAVAKAVKDAEEKAKAPTEAEKPKAAPERTEQGKFAPKAQEAQAASAPTPAQPAQAAANNADPQQPRKYEAPQRFNDQAKAEWEAAPDSVKAEVHRSLENLEKGYTKHKESAERYESFRDIDELTRGNGGDLRRALDDALRIDQVLRSDPVRGLADLARTYGFDLQGISAHIAGLPQQAHSQQVQATINGLQREVQRLQGELSQIHQKSQTEAIVNEFWGRYEDAENLRPQIENILKTVTIAGRTPAEMLENAYSLARMMAPQPPQQQASASPADIEVPKPASSAQPNPAGQKSINGAPSTATALKARPKDGKLSIRDAVANAMIRGGHA